MNAKPGLWARLLGVYHGIYNRTVGAAELQRQSEARLWAIIAEIGGLRDWTIRQDLSHWFQEHPHNRRGFDLERIMWRSRRENLRQQVVVLLVLMPPDPEPP